jgi:hypothetical protein
MMANNPTVEARELQSRLWMHAEQYRMRRGCTRNWRLRCDAPEPASGRVASNLSHAASRRSSVSRVPEIGTHGLKGGPVSPLAAR